MTVRVRWPDGHVDQAPTYRAVERQMRGEQWHRYGRGEFRLEMRSRAEIWSGVAIRTTGTSKRFVQELARAGLLTIEGSETR